MKSFAVNADSATVESGPATPPKKKPPKVYEPPRRSAPGALDVVLAPARHMRSSLNAPQPGHVVDAGTQSATHSERFPTMSKAPRAETQRLRAPVRMRSPMLQSVVASPVRGSGVPFA